MSQASLTVTESAKSKLKSLQASQQDPQRAAAVRLRVLVKGAAFRYEFQFVATEGQTDDDRVIEAGVSLLLDAQSARHLDGATLDYVDDLSGAGFRFENPNGTPLSKNPLAIQVQEILDSHINPSVAEHGGHVSLVDLRDTTVYLELGGGCQGCGRATQTLRDGIVVMLKEAIPEISEVLDVTDHASGATPYYQP